VCEDDVVARSVSTATAGCCRASEAEFEDHVCGVMWLDISMRCSFNVVVVSRSPTICGAGAASDFGRVP